MTETEAFEIILSWPKEITIDRWPKRREMGLVRMEDVAERWELRVWNENEHGVLDGVKWDYEGKTLADCVKLHMVHEQ